MNMRTHYLRWISGLCMIPLVTLGLAGWAFACMGTGASHQHDSTTMGHTPYDSPAEKAAQGEPQSICPITGGKINKSVFVDYHGKRVYFCCASCPKAFLADPEKYVEEMEAKGIVLEKAHSTTTHTEK